MLAVIGGLRNEPRLRRDVIDARGRWLVTSGRARVQQGDVAEGIALLREAHGHRSALFGEEAPMMRSLAAEIARAEATGTAPAERT
jgi:hypothetical protein